MVSVRAHRSDAGSDAKADERDAQVAELSAALRRHGHPVTVHTAATGAEPTPPAPVERPLAHLKDFVERLARHVDTDRPDILHSHGGPSGMVAALIGRRYGIPVVHTYHELDAHSRRRDDRISIERAVGRAATRIVAASSADVFELVRIGVPRAKISIVPPGVDVDHFSVTGSRVSRHPSLRRIITRSRVMTDRDSAT